VARVLVTGCGGFVGRVLAEQLLGAGHAVFGAERETRRVLPAGVKALGGDLTTAATVRDIVEASRPDWIVHLAAQSSVRRSFDDPAGTLSGNTLPALHLLESVRVDGRAVRVLLVGSADEYGVIDPSDLPVQEAHAVNPESPYALAKTVQARYGALYAARYGVDVVMTRSFNHTGPGQRDAFVLPAFARQLCEIRAGLREAVLHVGNLDVRRDFTDVRDVCNAYIALLERGRAGEVYNVCSGESISLREALERMRRIAGVDVTIEVDPERLRPVDMPELRGDAAKIRRDTGWEASIPFDETLRSLIEYWQDRVSPPEHGAGAGKPSEG